MTEPSCLIRAVSPDDADWHARLAWLTESYCAAIEEELSHSWLRTHRRLERARRGEISDVLARLVAEPTCAHLLMVDCAGAPVGYFLGLVKPCVAEDPHIVGYVNGLYVVPAFRRRGIADQLVRRGVAWFRSQGIRMAELYVGIGNDAARAFWRKHGFATSEEVLTALLPD